MTAEALELRELVAGPGVYPGLPEDVYHSDPIPGGSLSSTGASKLIPPGTAQKYRHWVSTRQPPKAAFEFGHLTHFGVLGVGPIIDRFDFRDWRTNDAKAARDASRAAGRIPVLTKDTATADAMVRAVRKHQLARSLLNRELGTTELSLFASHDRTGVMRRGRIDFLRDRPVKGPVLVVDYKTCADASDDALQRAIANLKYHLRAAWYLALVKALGLADDPRFVWVFQEKTPPFAVHVVQPDHDMLRAGRILAGQALAVFASSVRDGRWPGYGGTAPTILGLPRWAMIGDEG